MTSPYKINWAIAELAFIKPDLVLPKTRVNIDGYEGSILDIKLLLLIDDNAPAAQSAAPSTALTAASLSPLAVLTVASPLSPVIPMAMVQLSVSAPSNGPSQQQPPPPLADATNILWIKLPHPSILFIPPLIPPGFCRNELEFQDSSGFWGNLGGNPPSIHYQRHNLKSTYSV